MNSVKSNNLILRYQNVTLSGCKDIEIRKFEFVVKTQFLCKHSAENAPIFFEVSPTPPPQKKIVSYIHWQMEKIGPP